MIFKKKINKFLFILIIFFTIFSFSPISVNFNEFPTVSKIYALSNLNQQQLDQTASILSSIQNIINQLKIDIQSLFSREAKAATETIGLIRQDCTGYSNCFISLSAWEAAYGGITFGACAQGDLVCADKVAIAQIDGAWTSPDTTAVIIDGWITDATHYIRIYTTAAARHTGKWDSNKYRLVVNSQYNAALIIQEEYVRIEGLQIENTYNKGPGTYPGGVNIGPAETTSSNIKISNNLIRETGTGTGGSGAGITLGGGNNLYIWNNIIYGFDRGINLVNYGSTAVDNIIYNNTFLSNNVYGINFYPSPQATARLYNNIANGNGTDYSFNSIDASGNNISQDTTSPNVSLRSKTVSFVDTTNKDFHLSSSDTSAKDAGTNLSADANLAFSDDIDGNTRPIGSAWDIGADETGGVPPPDTTPPVLSSGSPTGALPSGTTQTTLSVEAIDASSPVSCKYGQTSGTTYSSMTGTLSTANGTTFTATITGLTNGTSYNYYVRCSDASSNVNTTDYSISFSVSAPAGDTTSPTVSITSPTNGTTVSGTITVLANASDNVAVAGVQFKLNTATNLGTEDTTSPYSYSLNTTTIIDGSHTLLAVARDTSNNYTTSSIITVIVNNASPPPPDTTTPSTPTNLTATVISSSQINLSWTASTDNVGVTGYKIYRCTGLACAPTVQIVTSATNSYPNTGLTASTAYTYAVSAYDVAGNESAKSNIIGVLTLASQIGEVITTLTVTNPTSNILTNVPVSFGVPFSENLGIQNPNAELTIFNSLNEEVPSQWTITSKWNHQTGFVKWALVDFLTNLAPNEQKIFTVARGSSQNPLKPLTILNQATYFEINTGKIIAKISKQNFNFLDAVLIDANNDGIINESLITSGVSQGLSYMEDGTALFNTLGPPEKISVELSGPIHSVIRAEGWFKNSSQQKEYLYYIARYHFWADSDYVRVLLTITDRHDTNPADGWYDPIWNNQQVNDLKLNLKGNLGGNIFYWFGNESYGGSAAKISQDNSYTHSIINNNTLQKGYVKLAGDWYPILSDNANFNEPQSSYQINSSVSGASAKFIPVLPIGGSYEVFVSWGAYKDFAEYLRATNVPYTIQYSSGSQTVTVPVQSPNANGWYSLGTFSFNAESNSSVAVPAYALVDAVKFSYRGPEVIIPDSIVYIAPPDDANANRSNGIGGLSGTNGGVFISFKEFWQNYPKAIEADSSGNFNLGLLPGGPHYFMGGMGKTSEFTMVFTPPNPNLSDLKQKLITLQDFPLKAIAPSRYYYDTKALELIGYTPKIDSPSEDMSRWDEITQKTIDVLEQEQQLNNAYSWRDYGDYLVSPTYGATGSRIYDWANNQHNHPYGAMVQFLRNSDSRWWKWGESSYRHSSDIDFVKYRPFRAKYNGTVHRKGECYYTQAHVCQEPILPMSFEWRYALLYYFLTGDSFSKDIAQMNFDAQKEFYHGDNGLNGAIVQTRVDFLSTVSRDTAWVLWGLLNGYEEFNDQSYLDHASLSIDKIKTSQDSIGTIGLDPNSYNEFSPGMAVSYQPEWGGWMLDTLGKYVNTTSDTELKNVLIKAIEHLKTYTLRKQEDPNSASQEIAKYMLNLWTYEKNPSVENFNRKPAIGVVKSVQDSKIYLDTESLASTYDINEFYLGKVIEFTSGAAIGKQYEITSTGQDALGVFLGSACTSYSFMFGSKCVTSSNGKAFNSVGVAPGDLVNIYQFYEHSIVPSYNFNIVNNLIYYYLETGDIEYKNLAQEFFRYAHNKLCGRSGDAAFPSGVSCAIPISLSSATLGDPLSFPFLFLNESAGLLNPPLVDTTPPSTPTNLTATAVSSSQINLSWTASTDNVGVAGYKIYRCAGSGCAPTVQIATSLTNSYSNTGLTVSTAYTYAVSAYDSANNESAKSSIVSTATQSPTPECSDSIDNDSDGKIDFGGSNPDPDCSSLTDNNESDTTSPTISSVISTTLASTTARIDWTTNEPSTSQVEYGFTTQYGASTTLDATLATSHSVSLSNLSPDNTTYNFRVRSKDSSNNESISTNNTFITPGLTDIIPPASTTNLTANNITQTSVDLVTWTAAGDDGNTGTAYQFDIRYTTGELTENTWNNAGTVRATGEPNPRPAGSLMNYTLLGLTPNTTYKAALKTLDENLNQSPVSNIITFTTLAAPTTPPTTPGGGGGGGSGGGGGGGGGSFILSDTTPPPQITELESQGADKQVRLIWKNPTNSSDYVRTIIVRKEWTSATSSSTSSLTTLHATSTKDGQIIYEGTEQEFTDINLKNNETYYYSIFTIDRVPNYSLPATTTAKTIEGKTSFETLKKEQIIPLTGQGGENNSKTIKTSFFTIKKGTFKRTLKFGMKGKDVKILQEALFQNKEELYPQCQPMNSKFQIKCSKKEIITGYFGKQTKDGLIKFQEKYKITKKGTGILNKKTIKKIYELYLENPKSTVQLKSKITDNKTKEEKDIKQTDNNANINVKELEEQLKALKVKAAELIKKKIKELKRKR